MQTIGTGAKASYKASVGVRQAGLTFPSETGGAGASDASKVFNYIGTKGAKAVKASENAGKTGATGAALTANYGQSIGSWNAVGTVAQKTGTVSLSLFAKIIGRR
ncbi:hypothetical protein ACFW17_35440 [Streptomyces sp. NPDC058961]|uniref:hypothetical protein n=1 Tax=Streptomyces sp. NPDC058961 TaxID=3346680 RepID=UPI00369A24B2